MLTIQKDYAQSDVTSEEKELWQKLEAVQIWRRNMNNRGKTCLTEEITDNWEWITGNW